MTEVYEKLQNLIVDSCGVEVADIKPDASLVKDLGVDSIDIMDLLYGIETEFKIQLSLLEFEEIARKETPEGKFDTDNTLTPEGIATLKKLLPDVPGSLYPENMMVQQIPLLITPKVLALWISQKITADERD